MFLPAPFVRRITQLRNYVATQEGDYTHYAFSIAPEDFEPFSYKLKQAGVTIWKDNKSEG
ncbi:hypothetical protein KPLM21_980003 [Klebsiella pneumoniae]|nr:hypothetical protein KPLM21_980003 [Klebsiella pneumoniae]